MVSLHPIRCDPVSPFSDVENVTGNVSPDANLRVYVRSMLTCSAMESVHFRNGMLNKISNGIHPNYLDLGMMSNKEVSLTYLPFVRLDEQVRLGRGTMNSNEMDLKSGVDRTVNCLAFGLMMIGADFSIELLSQIVRPEFVIFPADHFCP
ncbi:hypothetical protein BLNAU_22651 [Blattamonas nauphoetae]|uniref:Uncharacterized protein n=1 Tax=Blattamonas nauphoetae TaxID=2049346 RepID=A0ABQ9WSW3_9EUKA|nr:hypothetical protein BLNAU_22651 [Blattamonas nauphoetae]